MPNIKSSKKDVKRTAKKTLLNHEKKARIKNLIKNCDKAIEKGDKEEATRLFKDLQSNIDAGARKNLVKKNTANREKSRLNKKIKNMK